MIIIYIFIIIIVKFVISNLQGLYERCRVGLDHQESLWPNIILFLLMMVMTIVTIIIIIMMEIMIMIIIMMKMIIRHYDNGNHDYHYDDGNYDHNFHDDNDHSAVEGNDDNGPP